MNNVFGRVVNVVIVVVRQPASSAAGKRLYQVSSCYSFCEKNLFLIY